MSRLDREPGRSAARRIWIRCWRNDDVGDNGDGIALITDNGDVSMVTATNDDRERQRRPSACRIESDASGGKL
jgi:hypothetical protein